MVSSPPFGSLSEKSFSVFSVSLWCKFSLAISTRRQGGHGVYTEKSDFSDRMLWEELGEGAQHDADSPSPQLSLRRRGDLGK